MYLSKIISVAVLTALASAAATPSNLEARQESACRQAQSGLKQTSQYYKSLAEQWNGSAREAVIRLISQLDAETTKVAETCAKLAEAEKSAHKSYSDAESDLSDRFS
ncbi:hypothetical protein BDV27DRAFT_135769 [Aspergillus caelatus]|uniref:Uncharacterized protein n=2 Tax=Aspergillus subgen. Circumdati TaxID=2720871 RepID=A0A5N6ZS60_9EURO|nr:uncharacterized protein BDV27DRAFT_135769 [Aspergillus caelatus]KAE8359689.1 hypothetical protein BDV27DRAFT_135769 [Aspergillus caelatus]KAE8418546.1 hypothetical protein BDV36DRAFT_253673 [Aspergillus pseudocaelatus]